MLNNCGINKVFLLGVISKEPRWHKNGQGIELLCFTIVTQEDIGKNGTTIEHLETHLIKAPTKSIADLHLKKGQTVHIEGKIQTTAFTDEQQIRRYKTEIMAIRMVVVAQANTTISQELEEAKYNQL
jgi:single-strand DNA-binding protein